MPTLRRRNTNSPAAARRTAASRSATGALLRTKPAAPSSHRHPLVLGVVEGCQEDDGRARGVRLGEKVETSRLLAQTDVEQQDIGWRIRGEQAASLVRGSSRSHDHEIGLTRQQRRRALAHRRMIVHDRHPDGRLGTALAVHARPFAGHSKCTSVPPSSGAVS